MEETIILPDALPTMKTCSKCKVEKSATSENFGNDKRNKDNFQGKCRACENKRRRVDAKLIEPVREACADEAEFQEKLEWFRLSLDKAAAEFVLNKADAKFTKRAAARASLEQTLAAMKKLRPNAFKIAPTVAPVAVVRDAAKRPHAETHPFKSNYRVNSPEWKIAHTEWQNLCRFLDGTNDSPSQDVVESPKAKAEAPKASKAVAPREPLVPIEPIPDFDLIYVLPDGWLVYPNLTHAEPPLPSGATFIKVPAPPGYSDGDHKIAPGHVYSRDYTCWFRS